MRYIALMVATLAGLLLIPHFVAAESIDGKTTAQIVVDREVQTSLNKWALNKFSFSPPDQPCYFTAIAGKRLCSFPAAPTPIAALFTAQDFQSVKGSSSWECYYARPKLAVVLPKMLARINAAGLGADPYVGHLEAALAYLWAWYGTTPVLPLMKAGGYCEVNIAP